MEAVARCVRKHAGLKPGEGTKARSTSADMDKPSRRIQNGRNGRVAAVQPRERTPAYESPDA